MNKTAHIAILQFQGRSGGFATRDTTRWTVKLVSDAGEHRLDEFMTEGYGYSSLQSAENAAAPFKRLLDIPVRYGRIERVTITKERIVYEDAK